MGVVEDGACNFRWPSASAMTADRGVAPGVVVVFRDKDLEQEVLLRRHSRILLTGTLPRPPAREHVGHPRPTLHERLAPNLDALRAIALLLGRLPQQDEAPTDTVAALATNRVAWPRAIEILREDLEGDETFARSRATRHNDLLVHLALMQFPGAPKYRSLPRSFQADIKAFFRSHSAAHEEGRRLLFAVADKAGIRQDVELALAAQLGGLRGNHWFRFRSSTLSRLPSRLRVLVGCAEVLQGGVEACDFVDIDLEAPRIMMVTCDDIDQYLRSNWLSHRVWDTYEAILDACCEAWNALMPKSEVITSIGTRDRAQVRI
jgi:DNA phosphorothioation-associated putative methyltransferase